MRRGEYTAKVENDERIQGVSGTAPIPGWVGKRASFWTQGGATETLLGFLS